MQHRKKQPVPITGALAGGGVLLTFLFWINISWAFTLTGTQLRSYHASGLAARTLLLPQTRASCHSCLPFRGQLLTPRQPGLMSLTPFSALLFWSRAPFAHCGSPVFYAVVFLTLPRRPLSLPPPTLFLQFLLHRRPESETCPSSLFGGCCLLRLCTVLSLDPIPLS